MPYWDRDEEPWRAWMPPGRQPQTEPPPPQAPQGGGPDWWGQLTAPISRGWQDYGWLGRILQPLQQMAYGAERGLGALEERAPAGLARGFAQAADLTKWLPSQWGAQIGARVTGRITGAEPKPTYQENVALHLRAKEGYLDYVNSLPPETKQIVNRETRRINYSGYDARLAAAQEIVEAGDYSPEAITGVLKGHEDWKAELIGQVIYDPLNFAGVVLKPLGLTKAGRQALVGRRATEAVGALPELGRIDQVRDWLLTPLSKTLDDQGTMMTYLHRAAVGSDEAGELITKLQRLKNPDELAKIFTNVADKDRIFLSETSRRKFLRHLDNIDLDAIEVGKKGVSEVVDEVAEMLSGAADAYHGVGPASALERFNRRVKSIIGIPLIGMNPAVASKNIINAAVTGVWDEGALPLAETLKALPGRGDAIRDFFVREGLDPKIIDKWIFRGFAEAPETGLATGLIGKIAVPGRIMRFMERFQSAATFKAGYLKTWDALYGGIVPQLTPEIIQQLGPHGDDFASLIRHSNPGNVQDKVTAFMKAVESPEAVAKPLASYVDQLSPGIAQHWEEMLAPWVREGLEIEGKSLDEVLEMLRAAGARIDDDVLAKVVDDTPNLWQLSRKEYLAQKGVAWDKGDEALRASDEWRVAVQKAVSEGRLNPIDAEKGGLLSPRPVRDTGRFQRAGWQPLPDEPLYHVTTGKSGVLDEGLRTRLELGMEKGRGLGGGDADTVSLTTNREIAENIEFVMKEARRVARGEITLEDLVDMARRGEGAESSWLGAWMKRYNPGHAIGDPLPENFQNLIKGLAETGDPLTEEARLRRTWDAYNSMLWHRQDVGGPNNPIFFATDYKALAQVPESEIAILEFRARPGAQGVWMGGLEEWRTFSGKAVRGAWEAEAVAPEVARPAMEIRFPAMGEPSKTMLIAPEGRVLYGDVGDHAEMARRLGYKNLSNSFTQGTVRVTTTPGGVVIIEGSAKNEATLRTIREVIEQSWDKEIQLELRGMGHETFRPGRTRGAIDFIEQAGRRLGIAPEVAGFGDELFDAEGWLRGRDRMWPEVEAAVAGEPPVRPPPIEVDEIAPLLDQKWSELVSRLKPPGKLIRQWLDEAGELGHTPGGAFIKRGTGEEAVRWGWLHDRGRLQIWNRLVEWGQEAGKVDELTELAARVIEPEDFARALIPEDILSKAAGATETPSLSRLAEVQQKAARSIFAELERIITADFQKPRGIAADVMPWIDQEVLPAMRDAQTGSLMVADLIRNDVMLNYGRRMRFDPWVDLVFPYHFWFDRSMGNWLRRIMADPAKAALYAKLRTHIIEKDRDLPSRLQGSLPFAVGNILPNWAVNMIFLSPEKALIPFPTIFKEEPYERPEEKLTSLGRGMEQMQNVLPMYPSPLIQYPLALSGALGEKEQWVSGPQTPPGRLIRAASATGWGRELGERMGFEVPPTGINIEAPLLRAAGIEEVPTWEKEYWPLKHIALMAEQGEITQDEAVEAMRSQSGPLWEEAQRRTTYQKAWPTLTGATGFPAKIRPGGEQEVTEARREQQEAESYERYREYFERHPGIGLTNLAWQMAGGEGFEEQAKEWLQWYDYRQYKEERDSAIDEYIRENPGDTKGLGELAQVLGARRPAIPDKDFQRHFKMTDEEYQDALSGNLIWRVQEFKPDYDDFEQFGYGQYDAWQAAVQEFYSQTESGESPWMQELIEEAMGTMGGLSEEDARSYVVSLIGGQEGIEEHFGQYDSILEAAQRVYKDSYIDGAYEARDEAYAPWGAWKDAERAAGFDPDAINQQWDQYHTLPEGTGQRSAFLKQYPEMLQHLEFKDQYREEHPEAIWENVEAQVQAVERGFGPVEAVRFISQIMDIYSERGWTEEELRAELADLTFPGFAPYREMRQREPVTAQRETPTAPGAAVAPAAGRAVPQYAPRVPQWAIGKWGGGTYMPTSRGGGGGGWGGGGGGGGYQRSPWQDWGPLEQRFTWRT